MSAPTSVGSMYSNSVYDAQHSVWWGLDILNLHLFVLHNTDTISFPLFNSRFLRYNEQQFPPNKKITYPSGATSDSALFLHNKQKTKGRLMPRGDLTCFYPVIIKSTVHIQRCGQLWSVKIWIFLTLENTTDTTHSMYSTKYPFFGWSPVSRLCCQERHWTGQRGGSRSGHWPAQSVGSCSILPTIHSQCLFPSTRKEDFNIGSRNWEMKSRHKILFTKNGKLRNFPRRNTKFSCFQRGKRHCTVNPVTGVVLGYILDPTLSSYTPGSVFA